MFEITFKIMNFETREFTLVSARNKKDLMEHIKSFASKQGCKRSDVVVYEHAPQLKQFEAMDMYIAYQGAGWNRQYVAMKEAQGWNI